MFTDKEVPFKEREELEAEIKQIFTQHPEFKTIQLAALEVTKLQPGDLSIRMTE